MFTTSASAEPDDGIVEDCLPTVKELNVLLLERVIFFLWSLCTIGLDLCLISLCGWVYFLNTELVNILFDSECSRAVIYS